MATLAGQGWHPGIAAWLLGSARGQGSSASARSGAEWDPAPLRALRAGEERGRGCAAAPAPMQHSGIRRDYQLSVALRHQLSAKERAQESQLWPSPALAVQVVAQPWPRALHQPHQAALAFPFPSVQVGAAAARRCYLCSTIISVILGCCWNRSCLPISSFPGEMYSADPSRRGFGGPASLTHTRYLVPQDARARPVWGWTAPCHPCPVVGHPKGP